MIPLPGPVLPLLETINWEMPQNNAAKPNNVLNAVNPISYYILSLALAFGCSLHKKSCGFESL